MSSLNINDLYKTSDRKNEIRFRIFDNILKKIHIRIKNSAINEKMYCDGLDIKSIINDLLVQMSTIHHSNLPSSSKSYS